MSLKARLTEDMKDAMRAKDKDRLATIRLILAALKQREVDERIQLDDAQTLSVIEKSLTTMSCHTIDKGDASRSYGRLLADRKGASMSAATLAGAPTARLRDLARTVSATIEGLGGRARRIRQRSLPPAQRPCANRPALRQPPARRSSSASIGSSMPTRWPMAATSATMQAR